MERREIIKGIGLLPLGGPVLGGMISNDYSNLKKGFVLWKAALEEKGFIII